MSATISSTPQTPTWVEYLYSWGTAPADSWSTAAIYYYTAESTELITIQELIDKLFDKNIQEQINIFDTFSQTFNIIRDFVDSIGIIDNIKNNITKSFNEFISTNDDIKKQFIQQLTDTLNINDDIAKHLFNKLVDSIQVNDTLSKSNIKEFNEFISTNDDIKKQFIQQLSDNINLIDNLTREFIIIRDYSELLNIIDDINKLSIKNLDETFSINEDLVKDNIKRIAEFIDINDVFGRQFTVIREFLESINLNDLIEKNILIPFSESFGINDSYTKALVKNINETLVFQVSEYDPGVYIRNFYETITILDQISKTLEKPINENIQTKDYFIHPIPQIVLENVTTWSDYDPSFWEKEGLDIKLSNYNDWKNLKEGDYEYKKALVRIAIDIKNLPINVDDVTINEIEVVSDVYDIDISGTGTILAADTNGTIIYYGRTFHRIPDVVILSFNSTAPGFSVPVITEITESYFKCKIVDANNNLYDGDISWKAEGY